LEAIKNESGAIRYVHKDLIQDLISKMSEGERLIHPNKYVRELVR